MIADLFRLSWKSIREKGRRSWLTMIGIFIGIAAVVSLISIGQGMREGISGQFEALGSNTLLVTTGTDILSGYTGGTAAKLTEHDLELIKGVRGVDIAGGMIFRVLKVEFGQESAQTYVIAMPLDETENLFESFSSLELEHGRGLEQGDRYKVVVGHGYTHGDVFDKAVKIGDRLVISDRQFDVVGSYKTLGNPEDDKQAYIPLDVARELFNEPDDYMMIMVSAKDQYKPSDVADRIAEEMRNDRNLERGEEDFTVQTLDQLLESFSVILDVTTLVLVGIAAISLLVGGIGIMNTMYTSVLEQTREIGVMKATGASERDITMIFLMESGLLGVVGGAIGVVIGVGIGLIFQYAAAAAGVSILKAYLGPELVVGAFLFSFVVGCLSGWLPAREAARLNPVDALRYE